jgi:hypothetical protein
MCLRFGVEDRGRKETKAARRSWNIESARDRERLPGVDRFSSRNYLQITLDQFSDAQKNACPFRRWFSRPIRKRRLRCRDCEIDITSVTSCHLRVWLSGRRFDVIEIFSADWLDKLAVDEIVDPDNFGVHRFEILSVVSLALNGNQPEQDEYRKMSRVSTFRGNKGNSLDRASINNAHQLETFTYRLYC